MGQDTKIQWCHHTANTWWGCTKVSEGCKNCYAERDSKRYGFDVWGPRGSRRMMKGVWNEVRKWAVAAASSGERRRVFWGSMMDVCEDRPELVEPRKRFCGIIEELEDLDFLILTKRPENYISFMPWGAGPWPVNAWPGTSCENQEALIKRAPELKRINGGGPRWLSCEPLLGPLNLFSVGTERWDCLHGWSPDAGPEGANTPRIDWVIVGGESGGGARQLGLGWIRDIVSQCQKASVPVFVKQVGAWVASGGSMAERPNDRKGGDMSEWPEDIRVREFPAMK